MPRSRLTGVADGALRSAGARQPSRRAAAKAGVAGRVTPPPSRRDGEPVAERPRRCPRRRPGRARRGRRSCAPAASTRSCPRALIAGADVPLEHARPQPRVERHVAASEARRPSRRCRAQPIPASRRRWRSRAATTRARTAGGPLGAARRRRRARAAGRRRAGRRGRSGRAAARSGGADSARGRASSQSQSPLRPRARAGVAGRRRASPRAGKPIDRCPRMISTLPLLERLPERLERRPRELGELVEEEHAAVGERDLPWARRRAAADEPGGEIVWCGARNGRSAASRAVAEPGDAVDPRDLDRLLERRRRQDAGEPPREHRLAGSGRPDHQQVVAAGGRDLERAPRVLLPAHVGEVERAGPRPTGTRPRAAGRSGASVRAAGRPAARASGRRAPRCPSTSAASAAFSTGTISRS